MSCRHISIRTYENSFGKDDCDKSRRIWRNLVNWISWMENYACDIAIKWHIRQPCVSATYHSASLVCLISIQMLLGIISLAAASYIFSLSPPIIICIDVNSVRSQQGNQNFRWRSFFKLIPSTLNVIFYQQSQAPCLSGTSRRLLVSS